MIMAAQEEPPVTIVLRQDEKLLLWTPPRPLEMMLHMAAFVPEVF